MLLRASKRQLPPRSNRRMLLLPTTPVRTSNQEMQLPLSRRRARMHSSPPRPKLTKLMVRVSRHLVRSVRAEAAAGTAVIVAVGAAIAVVAETVAAVVATVDAAIIIDSVRMKMASSWRLMKSRGLDVVTIVAAGATGATLEAVAMAIAVAAVETVADAGATVAAVPRQPTAVRLREAQDRPLLPGRVRCE